jgi:hypothetical protein
MVTREFYAQATAKQIAEEWLQRKVQGKRVIRSAEAIYNKPTLEQAQKIKQANAIYSQLITKPEAQQQITRATERKESQRALKEEATRRGFDDPREFAVRRQKLQEDVAQRKREERDNRRVQAGDTTKEQADQQRATSKVDVLPFQARGMGRTDLKVRDPISGSFVAFEKFVSETQVARKVQQAGQRGIVTGRDIRTSQDLPSKIIKVLTPAGAGFEVGGGAISFVGEKPVTSASLVAGGFIGGIATRGLLAKGGTTAFLTKTATATAGGVFAGSEAIQIASQPTTSSRLARTGETLAKVSLIGLGSSAAKDITQPISRGDIKNIQKVQQTVAKTKGTFREDTNKFTRIDLRKGDGFRIKETLRGELVKTDKGFVATGKIKTTVSKYGVPKYTEVSPFTAQVSPAKSPTYPNLKGAIGRTFTGDLRPATRGFSFSQPKGRLTKFVTGREVVTITTPKGAEFVATKPLTAGEILSLRTGDPSKFLFIPKRGQVSLTRFKPSVKPLDTTGLLPTQAVATLTPTTLQGIKPISLKSAPLFATLPSTSTRVQTRQLISPVQTAQQRRSLAQTLSQQSITSLSSRTVTRQDTAQESITALRFAPAPALTETITPTILTTPSRLSALRPKGIILPDTDIEVPKRKKKKKKRKQSKQGRVFAQDLTAKVLNLKPVKVSRKKARKLKSKPIGIRRGVIIR